MNKIEKTSTVDAVVNLLTSRIHDGTYVPGEKLPSERKLQDEFGVGRLALREALARMNAMGIIETSHGKGTFVQDDLKSRTMKNVLIPYFALNDSRRLRDLVDARGMIESEIAGLAARQRTDADLEKLATILERKFPPDVPLETVARQDLLFHVELALIVDNQFLMIMHKALMAHIQEFLNEFVKSKNDPVAVMAAHCPILEAIARRDAEGARHLARLHVSFSMKDYKDFVAKNSAN